ncbi:Lethal(3)malignant brain tumor-like protein 4 [Collichthys lucidus]|uniref:Lethal(3)malignant brain tumor-like protein 4 n=1 Tax=Collichthys lucidus TaxID=240159 RepID=A0A4U5VJJ7_COLLU|nr:Lethal(3)malignant brain tumor-like protein 4 [Collichthys lucidus]
MSHVNFIPTEHTQSASSRSSARDILVLLLLLLVSPPGGSGPEPPGSEEMKFKKINVKRFKPEAARSSGGACSSAQPQVRMKGQMCVKMENCLTRGDSSDLVSVLRSEGLSSITLTRLDQLVTKDLCGLGFSRVLVVLKSLEVLSENRDDLKMLVNHGLAVKKNSAPLLILTEEFYDYLLVRSMLGNEIPDGSSSTNSWRKDREQRANQWFSSHDISSAFCDIRDKDFEVDCRRFLNFVNGYHGDQRRVYTFPCRRAFLDSMEVKHKTCSVFVCMLLLDQCSVFVCMLLLDQCSVFVCMLLLDQCSVFVGMLLDQCSVFVCMLLDQCSVFVGMLLDQCSVFVCMLLDQCSVFVCMLLDQCSVFVCMLLLDQCSVFVGMLLDQCSVFVCMLLDQCSVFVCMLLDQCSVFVCMLLDQCSVFVCMLLDQALFVCMLLLDQCSVFVGMLLDQCSVFVCMLLDQCSVFVCMLLDQCSVFVGMLLDQCSVFVGMLLDQCSVFVCMLLLDQCSVFVCMLLLDQCSVFVCMLLLDQCSVFVGMLLLDQASTCFLLPQLFPPKDEKLDQFWIDFNLNSGCVSFFIDEPQDAQGHNSPLCQAQQSIMHHNSKGQTVELNFDCEHHRELEEAAGRSCWQNAEAEVLQSLKECQQHVTSLLTAVHQHSAFGCPYSDINMRKEVLLPDRLGGERAVTLVPVTIYHHGNLSDRLSRPTKLLCVEPEEEELHLRAFSPVESSLQAALHQSVFLSAMSPQPGRDLSLCWEQHSKLLPGVAGVHAKTVSDFIESLPGCEEQAKQFRDEQIDGRAFLLLTQRDIVRIMSIKLGPALKIYNSILMFKHAEDRNQSQAEDRSQSHAKDRSQSHTQDGSQSHAEDSSQSHTKDRSQSYATAASQNQHHPLLLRGPGPRSGPGQTQEPGLDKYNDRNRKLVTEYRRSEVVVVKGKLKLISVSGLVAALGILVLLVGVVMAALGYWPRDGLFFSVQPQKDASMTVSFSSSTPTPAQGEEIGEKLGRYEGDDLRGGGDEDRGGGIDKDGGGGDRFNRTEVINGTTHQLPQGFLEDFLNRYLYSDRLKVFGPLIMGIGIFLFICANAVLHENRDKKTKVINLRDIYSTVIDLHSLRKPNTSSVRRSSISPLNGLVNYVQSKSLETKPRARKSLPTTGSTTGYSKLMHGEDEPFESSHHVTSQGREMTSHKMYSNKEKLRMISQVVEWGKSV